MGIKKKPVLNEQLNVLIATIKAGGARLDDLVRIVTRGIESGAELTTKEIDDFAEYVKSTGKYTDEEIETLIAFLKKPNVMAHISARKGLFTQMGDLVDDITEAEANVMAKLAKISDNEIETIVKSTVKKELINSAESLPIYSVIEGAATTHIDNVLASENLFIKNVDDDIYKQIDDFIDFKYKLADDATDVEKLAFEEWKKGLKQKFRENPNIQAKVTQLKSAGKIKPDVADVADDVSDVADDVADDVVDATDESFGDGVDVENLPPYNAAADESLASSVKGKTGIIEDLLYGRLANYMEGLFVLLKGSFGSVSIKAVEGRIDDIVKRIEDNFISARNGDGFADDGLPIDTTLRKNIDTLKSKLQVEMKLLEGSDSVINKKWNDSLNTFTENTSTKLQAELDVKVRSIQNRTDLSDTAKSEAIAKLRSETSELISELNSFKNGLGKTASRQTIKELVERSSQAGNISNNILIDIRNGLARIGGLRATFKTYFDSGFGAWVREIMDAPNITNMFVKSDNAIGFKILKPKIAIILRPVLNEVLFGMLSSPLRILKKISKGGRIKMPNGKYMSVPLSYFCRFLWQTLSVQIFSALFEAVAQETFDFFGAGLERAQKDTTGYIVWDIVHNDDGFFDSFFKNFEWNPYFKLLPDSLAKKWGLNGVNDFTQAMGFNSTLGQRFFDYMYESKNEDALEVNLKKSEEDLEKMFDEIEENKDSIEKVSQTEIDNYIKAINSSSGPLMKKTIPGEFIDKEKAERIIKNITTDEGISESFKLDTRKAVADLISKGGTAEEISSLFDEIKKSSDKNIVSNVVVKDKNNNTYKLVKTDKGFIRYETPNFERMNTPPFDFEIEQHKLSELDI